MGAVGPGLLRGSDRAKKPRPSQANEKRYCAGAATRARASIRVLPSQLPGRLPWSLATGSWEAGRARGDCGGAAAPETLRRFAGMSRSPSEAAAERESVRAGGRPEGEEAPRPPGRLASRGLQLPSSPAGRRGWGGRVENRESLFVGKGRQDDPEH